MSSPTAERQATDSGVSEANRIHRRHTEINREDFSRPEVDKLRETREHFRAAFTAMADLYNHLESDQTGLPDVRDSSKTRHAGHTFSLQDARREMINEWMTAALGRYCGFLDAVIDGVKDEGVGGAKENEPASATSAASSGLPPLKKRLSHTSLVSTPNRKPQVTTPTQGADVPPLDLCGTPKETRQSSPAKAPNLDFPLQTPPRMQPFSL
uniref:Uncharacterized protein n=1 Tax=Chromera velia CCMP2878 TaxID=1169474 RepID=A0A0G4HEL9_9ALVE|mmetsp:Transcript_52969/g.103611  ORF Transcript_52969/g.103611 Transcript_52969/m.103611 type:complete len:211 (-) Transcript_52969:1608-2240(-)|eukprot:Cvel_980.t1-p1 / transcript=Cvel_980.t1 / gene=Cvel_980 / organism=Chromera_velia_CCMP2878 / gene_product=hypothetical protein / transcript_product=hypothetical protein / location=Cvel_scaffold31:156080-157859(+) / protein_length=210 / sequence_SO=supercontig / SO=protein_coding / is_pseudo=false